MIDKVLRLFLGLFISVWVARYLGPESFGLLSFGISFVAIFTTFGKLGLNNIIVRNIIKNPEEKNIIIGTSFVLMFFGSLLLILLVFIFLLFTKTNNYEKLVVLIISFSQLFIAFDAFDSFFQSQVKGKYTGLSGLASLIASSISRIIFIQLKFSVVWFAIAVVIEHLFKGVFLLFFYLKQSLTTKKLRFKLDVAKKLLKDSWPLIFSGLAVSLYMKIDQIMVKELIGNEAVGYYSVAVRLSEVWLFITVAINQSLFPAVIKAKKTSKALYHSRLQNLYQLLLIISISISILVFLFSGHIINILFGHDYLESVNILKIYVWSTIFVFLNNGSWSWYLCENLQHLAAIRLIIGALVNIVLNYFLIKFYGLEGAAIATLVSYSIASYFGNLFFKKTRINFILQTKAIFSLFNIRSLINEKNS
jgi:O-antigen/teichoic acid export membrane protein